MRLRLLGINYSLVNSRFEPINPSCSDHELANSGISARPQRESYQIAGGANEPGEASPHSYDKAGPH
jgi:hypothetical protein